MSQFRLLVVDDDPDTQLILSKILELEYEVVLADNGLDALGKIKNCEPDLVLADVAMPVMNGWEFVERLRTLPEYKTMPVVFLSAMAQKENIKEGYERGADLYLIKPVDPDRLLRMIRMKLEERNAVPAAKTYTLEQLNKPAAAQPAASPPAAQEAPSNKVVPRILIVDDDEDMRKVMQLELERWFEVITAEDGLAAMDKALHWWPDLFVIDWMLPKVSGYQMVEILRRTAEFQQSPIVFVSAKKLPERQADGRAP